MTSLRPTGQRILVQPTPTPIVSRGGIHLDVSYQPPTGRGKVVAVGQCVTDLKVGDDVAYRWSCVTDVEWNGGKLALLKVDDLTGILENV
jgi:co-chaperonin GroES (HSP10)